MLHYLLIVMLNRVSIAQLASLQCMLSCKLPGCLAQSDDASLCNAGSLPNCLANLPNLTVLDVSDNLLSGRCASLLRHSLKLPGGSECPS